jgi:hypothetical protein
VAGACGHRNSRFCNPEYDEDERQKPEFARAFRRDKCLFAPLCKGGKESLLQCFFEELKQRLGGWIVKLAEVRVDLSVSGLFDGKNCSGKARVFQYVAQTQRLRSRVGMAGDMQDQERRNALTYCDVSDRGEVAVFRRLGLENPSEADRPNGLLAEQMGPWEIRFRLTNDCGALAYYPGGARFCLGPLRIPVPRWCAPRVVASERLNLENKGVDCSLEVYLPVLGILIAYEGTIHLVEKHG